MKIASIDKEQTDLLSTQLPKNQKSVLLVRRRPVLEDAIRSKVVSAISVYSMREKFL